MINRLLTLCVCLLFSFVVAQENRTAEEYINDGFENLERFDCAFAQYLFQEALKQEPSNPQALLGKGRSLFCQGAIDASIEEFQQALSFEPNNVDISVRLAFAYQRQYEGDPLAFPGRLDDALSVLQGAESLEPNNPEVLNGKGTALYLKGDLAGARTALERAVSLASQPGSGLNNRDIAIMQVNVGRTYRELGELELALQAYRRAVTLSPTSSSAHSNVGNIHFLLGNCDEAVYELTQAARLNPNAVETLFNLGKAHFECGSVNSSVPYFEQALEIPNSLNIPPLYTYMARAYVYQGNYEEAVKRAQQGALLPPVTAEAFYYLGEAYKARNAAGDTTRAKEAYQSALDLDPGFQLAQTALAQLP